MPMKKVSRKGIDKKHLSRIEGGNRLCLSIEVEIDQAGPYGDIET